MRKMIEKQSKFFLFVLIFIFLSLNCYSENLDKLDWISSQKKLIATHYKNKDNFAAIFETSRLLMYINNDKEKRSLNYFIVSNYYIGKQYNKIINEIGKIKKRNFRENLLLSQAFLNQGLVDKSFLQLKNYNYKKLDYSNQKKLFNAKMSIYLDDNSYDFAFNEALKYPLLNKNDNFYKDLSKYRNLSMKSKFAGVALSTIFPGAGQFYSNQYLDGVISFVGVVSTAAGAYYFAKKGNKGVSYTLGVFSAFFYGENIYGAYNSAKTSNKEKQRKFKKKILKNIKKYDPFYGYEFDVIGIK